MQYQAGNYLCKVVSQDSGESQKKGTPFFQLKVQPQDFLDGEYPADARHMPPGVINFWLTDKTIEFVFRDLRNLGWVGEDFASILSHNFTGVELEATLEENAAGYPEWRLAFKREVIPLDAKKIDGLNRMFAKNKGKLPPVPSKGNPPKTQALRESKAYQETAAVVGPAGPADDEIPF